MRPKPTNLDVKYQRAGFSQLANMCLVSSGIKEIEHALDFESFELGWKNGRERAC